MAENEIMYVCKRTVVSTKPVQPGKHHPLSVLDRHMEKNHLRVVCYYKGPRGQEEAGEITKRLRESLSEVLTHFPIMTGRLIQNDKGHWMIKCNDAGVRMVEARAKGNVEDWLGSVDRGREMMLVHWEDMYYKPYFWSTFYVQVTEFEEGGLAIGLSCIHLLADPTCATMFIKAWADTTLPRKMLAPPFFDPLPPRRPGNRIPNHKPYTALIDHYNFSLHNSNPSTDAKHTTITLAFSDHMVQACMDMTLSSSATPNKPSPSPFEALAGLFWVCISKVKSLRNGLLNMSICLDARKVLGLHKAFFGNCMIYNKVHLDGLEEHKLSQAARAIGEVVAKMDSEGIMDLIEWLEQNESLTPPLMNSCDLICSNLEVVDIHSSEFIEKLRPIQVSYYVEPVFGIGQVLIFPALPGEGPLGRVAMVTLPEDEVIKLCEDELLMQFSPTILMGVNRTHA
ncbi:protein ECERIFERUM 26 [Juglans microcarpa x Juglans regia]|uniref:protein ECERIFERUM 26 n=1 Tax=Juglans microcarpa x Juglans regia TaxID=2249226 RepID=UPI001B7EFFBA|nr:protein ECERIFERUM 26 [Juglans microcarpa x Juglans regia]